MNAPLMLIDSAFINVGDIKMNVPITSKSSALINVIEI